MSVSPKHVPIHQCIKLGACARTINISNNLNHTPSHPFPGGKHSKPFTKQTKGKNFKHKTVHTAWLTHITPPKKNKFNRNKQQLPQAQKRERLAAEEAAKLAKKKEDEKLAAHRLRLDELPIGQNLVVNRIEKPKTPKPSNKLLEVDYY